MQRHAFLTARACEAPHAGIYVHARVCNGLRRRRVEPHGRCRVEHRLRLDQLQGGIHNTQLCNAHDRVRPQRRGEGDGVPPVSTSHALIAFHECVAMRREVRRHVTNDKELEGS